MIRAMNAERIAQFEKMAAADPTNEMAHFSLGGAYLQVGRNAEAARSFERCIEISPEMSKAYQLCGQAMIGAGWADKAVEVLLKGHELAARRGERLPQTAIAELLRSVGREPPTVKLEPAPEGGMRSAGFVCQRSGRAGSQLSRPPFKGPLGEWIFQNISLETWRAWIAQGTKVINELRLDFSREKDQEIYDQHMREFLGIDDELMAQLGARK